MRLFCDLRYRIFYGLVQQRGWALQAFGDPKLECDWNIYPAELDAQSVVYSGGVGNDISFEHALVERFGCEVVLFDPSPTGVATMEKAENQTPRFRFRPVALAGHCGVLPLHSPGNQEEGSYYASAIQSATTIVPCTDLSTLMREQGHSAIDLLKIDIEGSEYEVLDEIIERKLLVRQICVEFHHGILPGIRRAQTISAILRLVWRGYRLLDQTGNNHTFYWRGPWPPKGP